MGLLTDYPDHLTRKVDVPGYFYCFGYGLAVSFFPFLLFVLCFERGFLEKEVIAMMELCYFGEFFFKRVVPLRYSFEKELRLRSRRLFTYVVFQPRAPTRCEWRNRRNKEIDKGSARWSEGSPRKGAITAAIIGRRNPRTLFPIAAQTYRAISCNRFFSLNFFLLITHILFFFSRSISPFLQVDWTSCGYCFACRLENRLNCPRSIAAVELFCRTLYNRALLYVSLSA